MNKNPIVMHSPRHNTKGVVVKGLERYRIIHIKKCEMCGNKFQTAHGHPNQRFCGSSKNKQQSGCSKLHGRDLIKSWIMRNMTYLLPDIFICHGCGKTAVKKSSIEAKYCSPQCKAKMNARDYRKENPDYYKEWNQAHRDKLKEYQKRWRDKHIEHAREYARKYKAKKEKIK